MKTIKVNLVDNFDMVMICSALAKKFGYKILFKKVYLNALENLNSKTSFSLLVRNDLIYIYNGRDSYDMEFMPAEFLQELTTYNIDVLDEEWYFYRTFLIPRFRGYFIYRKYTNEIYSAKTTKIYVPYSRKDFPTKNVFLTNASLILGDYSLRIVENISIENHRFFWLFG